MRPISGPEPNQKWSPWEVTIRCRFWRYSQSAWVPDRTSDIDHKWSSSHIGLTSRNRRVSLFAQNHDPDGGNRRPPRSSILREPRRLPLRTMARQFGKAASQLRLFPFRSRSAHLNRPVVRDGRDDDGPGDDRPAIPVQTEAGSNCDSRSAVHSATQPRRADNPHAAIARWVHDEPWHQILVCSLGERHEKFSPLKPDAQAKDAPQRILRLRVRLRFAVRQFLPFALTSAFGIRSRIG